MNTEENNKCCSSDGHDKKHDNSMGHSHGDQAKDGCCSTDMESKKDDSCCNEPKSESKSDCCS